MAGRKHQPSANANSPQEPKASAGNALAGNAPAVFASALVLAALPEGQSTSRIQLLPAGKFHAVDGRPASLNVGYEDWLMDDAALAVIQSAERQNEIPVDIDHAMVYGYPGEPKPAAGWFALADLSLDESGLHTQVRWTELGRQAIASGQYKYISPVFWADGAGRPIRLHSVALTNDPAISNMAAVALSNQIFLSNPSTLENPVNKHSLIALATLLAIKPPASGEFEEAAVLSAVTALKAERDTLAANQFDAAKHIPLTQYTALQAEHAALVKKQDDAARAVALESGLKDGRILPAAKDYWAAQPLAALQGYLAVAQPLAALVNPQTQSKAENNTGGNPASGDAVILQSLTKEDLAAAAALSIEPLQFAKRKAALAKAAAAAQEAAA